MNKLNFLHKIIALFAILLMSSTVVLAAEAGEDGDPDAVGHSVDGNYWDLSPMGKIELPRIFLTKSESGSWGLDFFGSTKSALKSNGYVLVDKYGTKFTADEQQHAIEEKHHLHYPVVPANGHTVIDFSITRQLLFVFFTALVVLLLGLRTASKYKKGIGLDSAPKGKFQNIMESLIVYIRDNIAIPGLGDKADKYLPYLISVFLFIVLGNLLGLIPFGVTATSNISVTAALAVITFLLTIFGASKDYWRHIFNPPGMHVLVKAILVPIEFIGMFIKPFALAFRLFGNMVSGHLVIISIIGMTFIFGAKLGHSWGYGTSPLWFILTVGIYLLKIMVSVIQAYVFTMLSALFIGMAVEEHDHHDDHAHADHGHLGEHVEQVQTDLAPALATA